MILKIFSRIRTDFYFVAVEDNEVMGGCMLTDIVGEGDVSNVAVHEKYRRRGVAHALLEYMLQFGRKRGIRDFTLEVRQQNVAAQGYMKDWALFQKVYDPISMTNLRITQ